jgi:hypothetical protein
MSLRGAREDQLSKTLSRWALDDHRPARLSVPFCPVRNCRPDFRAGLAPIGLTAAAANVQLPSAEWAGTGDPDYPDRQGRCAAIRHVRRDCMNLGRLIW